MPEPTSGAVLTRGQKFISFDFSYSNVVLEENSARESLLLDMEYLRSTLGFHAGLGRGFEADISLPIYTMYGGFLDPFISDLHDAFGFPNKIRISFPNNLFRYHYRVDDDPVLERTSGGTWAGDLTLRVRKSFYETNPLGLQLAVHTALKLPTGSKNHLTGSETTDWGIGIAASRVSRSVGGYFHFNYLFPGSSKGLQTHSYYSLTAAFDWRFRASWPNLAIVIQYDQFQSFLESELPALTRSGRQALIGLRWRQSRRFHYEWRLAEDINATTPDFTFGFQLSINWPNY